SCRTRFDVHKSPPYEDFSPFRCRAEPRPSLATVGPAKREPLLTAELGDAARYCGSLIVLYMSMVGLPQAAVREAKDRVRAAIRCARFEFPPRVTTVNLAPADLPKGGGRFDLPIALGILAASGQLPREALARHEFVGELGLAGELRAVDGVLPAALACAGAGRVLVVPAANGA